MAQPDEDTLIEKAVHGDKQAFSELVNLHSSRIFGLAMTLLKDKDLADEAAQQTFVKAYLNLKKFRGESKFSGWLYRIAYRTSLDLIKKQKKLVPASSDYQFEKLTESEVKYEDVEHKEAWVRDCINRLAADDAALIRMFYYEKLSLNDIADTTGNSLSNVKVKIHRLRNKLKEMLEEKPKIIYHYG